MSESSLTLWNNVLLQFHKSKRYESMFFNAGYKTYKIGPNVHAMSGETCTPDIISCKENGDWLIVELSLQKNDKEGKKNSKLGTYTTINPRSLNIHGLVAVGKPNLIYGTDKLNNDITFCQGVFVDEFDCKDEEKLIDSNLRDRIKKQKGAALLNLPRLSFSIVPESASDQLELKRGLIVPIKMLFKPHCGDMTVEQIVLFCLGELADAVSPEDLLILKKNIIPLLGDLGKLLEGYITFSEKTGVISANDSVKNGLSSVAMEKIGNKLKKWSTTTQSRIDEGAFDKTAV